MKYLSSLITQSVQPPKRNGLSGDGYDSSQADVAVDLSPKNSDGQEKSLHMNESIMAADQTIQSINNQIDNAGSDSELDVIQNSSMRDVASTLPDNNDLSSGIAADLLPRNDAPEQSSRIMHDTAQSLQSSVQFKEVTNELMEKNEQPGTAKDQVITDESLADEINDESGINTDLDVPDGKEVDSPYQLTESNITDSPADSGVDDELLMVVNPEQNVTGEDLTGQGLTGQGLTEKLSNQSGHEAINHKNSIENPGLGSMPGNKKTSTENSAITSKAPLEVSHTLNEFIQAGGSENSSSKLETQNQPAEIPQVRIGHINVVIDDQSSTRAVRKNVKPEPGKTNSFGLRGL